MGLRIQCALVAQMHEDSPFFDKYCAHRGAFNARVQLLHLGPYIPRDRLALNQLDIAVLAGKWIVRVGLGD